MKIYQPYIAVFFFFLCFASCKKNHNSPDEPASSLVVQSIYPASGSFTDYIVIRGKNFAEAQNGNVVKFNGVEATVYQAWTDSIVAEVPKEAGTGAVTVTANGQTVTGPVFTYLDIQVSTFAGTKKTGHVDGPLATAEFAGVSGITIDKYDNLYVIDSGYYVRKISKDGMVSTLTGQGGFGYKDGSAGSAQFRALVDIAVDSKGNLLLCDRDNECIRKLSADGRVTTYAGIPGQYGYKDGSASEAKFWEPLAIAIDGNDNLYIADNSNSRVRKVSPDGRVSTLAGNGNTGFADGAAATAEFYGLYGISCDAAGVVYIADYINERYRKIANGIVSTVAGTANSAYNNSIVGPAHFEGPKSVYCDREDVLYTTEESSQVIRQIRDGFVTHIAGVPDENGYLDGTGAEAKFLYPQDIVKDSKGNIYVTDLNTCIRKITITSR